MIAIERTWYDAASHQRRCTDRPAAGTRRQEPAATIAESPSDDESDVASEGFARFLAILDSIADRLPGEESDSDDVSELTDFADLVESLDDAVDGEEEGGDGELADFFKEIEAEVDDELGAFFEFLNVLKSKEAPTRKEPTADDDSALAAVLDRLNDPGAGVDDEFAAFLDHLDGRDGGRVRGAGTAKRDDELAAFLEFLDSPDPVPGRADEAGLVWLKIVGGMSKNGSAGKRGDLRARLGRLRAWLGSVSAGQRRTRCGSFLRRIAGGASLKRSLKRSLRKAPKLGRRASKFGRRAPKFGRRTPKVGVEVNLEKGGKLEKDAKGEKGEKLEMGIPHWWGGLKSSL